MSPVNITDEILQRVFLTNMLSLGDTDTYLRNGIDNDIL